MTRPVRTPRDSDHPAGPGPARALARALVLGAVLGIACSGPAGCRGSGRSADAPAGSSRVGPDAAAGAVRLAGDVNGIEVRTWTVDPLGGPIGRALAEYASDGVSGGLDPRARKRWREHGFRLVEVPVEAVGVLEDELPHVDAVQRLWLGQPTVWTGLATRRLESDGGVLGGRPTPVRAALVVRSWVEPGVRRGPIRVELALSGTPLDGRGSSPLLMNELLLTHRLDPGMALAIVPAPPDESWDRIPADEVGGASDDSPEDPRIGSITGPAATPADWHTEGLGAGAARSEGVGEDAADGIALPPAPPGVADTDAVPLGPLDPGVPGAGSARRGSLGESVLVLPGRILSVPPRPAREMLVIMPGSR